MDYVFDCMKTLVQNFRNKLTQHQNKLEEKNAISSQRNDDIIKNVLCYLKKGNIYLMKPQLKKG